MDIPIEKQQKINWLEHIELIAAIFSGLLIVTAWLSGKNGAETLSITFISPHF